MGPRVIAIALAQLLVRNNNRSHLVHTADRSSRDSSIVSYQQTFTLRTTDRPTREEQGESDSGSTLEPGCTIIHALSLTGNCIPERIYIYIYIQTLAEIAAYAARLVALC